MTGGDLLAFALVLAVGQFSPGPDMILITRTALACGRSAAMACVAGITTGLVVHATLAVTSVSVLMRTQPEVWRAIQAVGAVYLLWLAWQVFRDDGDSQEKSESTGALGQNFRRGLMTNLLNPKVMVFFATLIALFTSGDALGWWSVAMAAVIVIEGLCLWGLWVVVLQSKRMRERYFAARRWINGAFALLLLMVAMKMGTDILVTSH